MSVQSQRDVGRAAAGIVLAMLVWVGDLQAQVPNAIAILERQITELQNAGKYAAALPLAERLVALNRTRYGEMSAQHAAAFERMAATYFFQSKFSDAEPVYKRVLAIREKVAGPNHASVLATLETLAGVYRYNGPRDLARGQQAVVHLGIREQQRGLRAQANALRLCRG